jgi:enoyl-CoA hydratase
MGEFVHLEIAEGVGAIRIDRQPANAIDRTVGEELLGVVGEASRRDDVGAIVVWGGDRIFAAGADIRSMADLDPEGITPVVSALGDACDRIEACPKVSIAAVNGVALGGGCELALACDLRYLAVDAKLGQPEVKIGVIPGAGATQRLPWLIGGSRAMELVLSGRTVGAEEAASIGLAHRLLPSEDVYGVALEDARAYASGPRRALAAAEASVRRAGPAREGLRAERAAFVALFDTRDQAEGMRAFLDKREPRFEGS